MITKQLKYIRFDWDGKGMTIQQPSKAFWINRTYLLSLMRFGLRCLTRKERKA